MALLVNPIPPFYRNHARRPVMQNQWFGIGARNSAQVTNRRHTKQQAYRLNFCRVKILWDSLSGGQLSTWQSFASTYTSVNKYGNTIVIGAWQWFARFNLRLIAQGQPLVTTAPPDPTPSYTPSITPNNPDTGKDWTAVIDPFPGAGESVLFRSKVNLPYSLSTPPKPLVSNFSINSTYPDPVILLPSSNIDYDNKKFFAEFLPIDMFGRTSGYQEMTSVSSV